jgi:hypothetical protein
MMLRDLFWRVYQVVMYAIVVMWESLQNLFNRRGRR